jgi:hypothetical protein
VLDAVGLNCLIPAGFSPIISLKTPRWRLYEIMNNDKPTPKSAQAGKPNNRNKFIYMAIKIKRLIGSVSL